MVGAVGGLAGGAAGAYVALRRRAIEKYVHELDRVSYEHEVVFSRLHERRVDVVDELYVSLVRAERAFSSWMHPMQEAGQPSQAEKATKAIDAGNAFIDYFYEHRIWLDQGLCDRIKGVADRLRRASIDFDMKDRMGGQTPDTGLWIKAWQQVNDEIPPIRESIESEFRSLLGVADVRPTLVEGSGG